MARSLSEHLLRLVDEPRGELLLHLVRRCGLWLLWFLAHFGLARAAAQRFGLAGRDGPARFLEVALDHCENFAMYARR